MDAYGYLRGKGKSLEEEAHEVQQQEVREAEGAEVSEGGLQARGQS